jgi:hypothetical protein
MERIGPLSPIEIVIGQLKATLRTYAASKRALAMRQRYDPGSRGNWA